MSCYSIVLCKSSAASILEDRHKLKVKFGTVKQSNFE